MEKQRKEEKKENKKRKKTKETLKNKKRENNSIDSNNDVPNKKQKLNVVERKGSEKSITFHDSAKLNQSDDEGFVDSLLNENVQKVDTKQSIDAEKKTTVDLKQSIEAEIKNNRFD